jgi:hypothetical protein
MFGPTFHVTISGSVVAVYAAVVSTITGVAQLSNFLRDRAKIKVSVRHNMEIVGDPRYQGKTLTIVRVVNSGRRPVTITTVGAQCLFPHNHFVLPDCNPPLPHELTEGKHLVAIMGPSNLDFSTLAFWEASDAIGRDYRLNVAPWHARALSRIRWRRQWRSDARAKRQTAKD